MKKRELRVVSLAIASAAVLIFTTGCARPGLHSAAAPANESSATAGPLVRVSGDINAAEPAIAAAWDGSSAKGGQAQSVYVVWVEHQGKDADVMVRHFNSEAQPLSSAVRVNPQPGVATAWRGDPPSAAIAPDGTLYVGWTAPVDSPSGHATNLYLSASHDGGKSFDPPSRVNDDEKPAVHGMHSLAIAKDGRIYVAWLDERNINQPSESANPNMPAGHHMESNREVFVASSSDGGRSFSANMRIAANACPCCKTSLAIGNDGHVYLSWRQVLPGDFRHIAIATSVDTGKTFSKPVIVSDDQWLLKGCPVTGAALLPEENGSLRVLWYAAGANGEHGIYWSESKDGGQTFSPRTLLATTAARGTPAVVNAGNGNEGVTWGVWEGNDNGVTQVKAASFADAKPSDKPTTFVAPGELPAAAAGANRVYIAYLLKENDKGSVWLTIARGNR
jgi:hypothetical protein